MIQPRKYHINIFILILWLLLSVPLFGNTQDWETSGYVKYLYSYNKNSLWSANPLRDHQLHVRLNNRWYVNENFTATMELRIRAFNGGSVRQLPGFKSAVISDYPYADLAASSGPEGDFFAYGQIDRASLDYTRGDWQFTLGRQRVAWGTSLVWNVIDLFNPQSVLDFDYEEKPGSDALRIQYFTGALGRTELVLKPAREINQRIAAFLWFTNSHNYDFYTLVAWAKNAPLIGGAFSGDIYGAGFRGEFKWTRTPAAELNQIVGLPFQQTPISGNRQNISAVLSVDYTFANSFYLHSETMYNSLGKTRDAVSFSQAAANAGLLSPARWSLFYELAYDVHPLVRADFFALQNPLDRSYVLAPSISFSAATNLDLYLIGILAYGTATSEFGNFGRAVFLRAKHSF